MQRERGGGFTLIEVLVVIVIVLVLAALLWPVVTSVRESGRQATCLNNQRQIAASLLIWAENHNERLPRAEAMWAALELPPAVLACPTAQRDDIGYVYNQLVGGMLVDLPNAPQDTPLTADGKAPDRIMREDGDLDPRHHGRYLASFLDGRVEALKPVPAAGAELELGQTVEGCGSANFAWLQHPGVKYGIAFAAPKSGTITRMTLQWKKDGGYGHGTSGRYTFALHADGGGHFPADTVLAQVTDVNPITAMGGYADGALHVELTATVIKGTIYHLVITNTDPNPAENWSSPNTLMTRVIPWDGTGCRGAAFKDGKWTPWSSRHPAQIYNTAGSNEVNGAHSPIMLTWADGTHTGDPYYSAAIDRRAYFYADRKAGEFIAWRQPTATIARVGVVVGKEGNPQTLYYHLETAEGAELAFGPIATAAQIGHIPTWAYATLRGVTLEEGKSYRLWFDSPDSPNAKNCFYQFVPYGEHRPPEWLECGWGGTASYYTDFIDGAWQARLNADMSFSLR